MRFQSAYPKALMIENEADAEFLISALLVAKKQYGEFYKDKAELIISWLEKEGLALCGKEQAKEN